MDKIKQKPSVGRIVHYVSYGTPKGEYTPQCRAAVVTEFYLSEDGSDYNASLAILNPKGMFFSEKCKHSEPSAVTEASQDATEGSVRMPEGGTWHWPERV